MTDEAARRPIKARKSRWAAALANGLVRMGVSPNAISIASIACAAGAAACLAGSRFVRDWRGESALLIAALACIQWRLLCNLLDGMVAVEGGKGSKSGEIFNDVPDRVADLLILVAAGYAVGGSWGPAMGWLAGALAVMTAYVRMLGRSLGAGIYFVGPMAKQHRMAAMTAACAIGAAVTRWGWQGWVLGAALVLVSAGCIATVVRRLRLIRQDLEGRA